MLYITAPKMTPRFMKGANVEGHITKATEAFNKKINEFQTILEAKAEAITPLLDQRLEKIFSNDVPHVVEDATGKAFGRVEAYIDKKVPGMMDDVVKSLMTETNLTRIKSTISDAVGDGLKPIADGFKMAIVGQKGNEAQAAKKNTAAATAQQRDFIKQTIIQKYPQAAMPLQIAEQAGVLDGLLDQAIANPDMAQGIIEKFIGGGDGGKTQLGGGSFNPQEWK